MPPLGLRKDAGADSIGQHLSTPACPLFHAQTTVSSHAPGGEVAAPGSSVSVGTGQARLPCGFLCTPGVNGPSDMAGSHRRLNSGPTGTCGGRIVRSLVGNRRSAPLPL